MDDFWFFKIANIIFSSAFLIWAWCIKKVIGVWLNPVSIFLLFWFLYTAFPLLVAFEVPVNPIAVIYILLFCIIFSLPTFLFRWSVAFKSNIRKPEAAYYFDTSVMRSSLYVLSGLSIVMVFFGILQQGISVNQVMNNPLSVGGEYAGKRYSGEIVSSVWAQIGMQCSYYTVALGGLIYGSRSNSFKRKAMLLIVVFMPALMVMLLQSAKGLFFLSIFIFVGGLLVARVYNKDYRLLSFSDFRSLMVYGLLIFPFLVLSFLARGLQKVEDFSFIVDRLRHSLISYSSVHLPAFSDWFSERYLNDSLMVYKQESFTVGFYTFMSFFQLAGDDRSVPVGVYDEYYRYGDYITGNLYTVFRGLITDFGLIGSLIFALGFGSVFCFGYWGLLTLRKSAFSITFFIYSVAISYQSYIISTLTWMTIPVAFLAQWFLLFLLMKVRVGPGRG
jgi:oligosaccharide repeat unit polymerase